jgi:sRNA-binding carbon storage regulator CsrA
MGLILGVAKGRTFYVGDTPVKVVDTESSTRIVLSVDGGPEFIVTDKEMTTILPNVSVSAGTSVKQGKFRQTLPRLVIDAPRSITILREELYKR